ncbi:hypothetical protein TSOC_011544 [Tetrabaena socialis]|uniref:MIB/HERC2 domain-containing protein n=1 Tax=Tetrabaena socialis TaxID=47790 RepID=A0A2J7ZQC6_9CHLO|nr:hypothetical protein TSOC_011544 [Tetrabaena socialis]|eukprot:PNH02475.1 hypothetical protein TSOC_011544 [Tetrabaena socialis]
MLLLSSRACPPSSLGLRQTRRAGGCLAARRVLALAPSHQLLHSQQQQLLLTSPRSCTAASAASGDPPAKPAAEQSTDGGSNRSAERCEDNAVENQTAAATKQPPRWDAGDVVTSENWRVGLKMVRGPDWSAWDNWDGGEGGRAGTIVHIFSSADCVYVQWDSQSGEAAKGHFYHIEPGRYQLCCAVPYTV